jgi:hypothetical protein
MNHQDPLRSPGGANSQPVCCNECLRRDDLLPGPKGPISRKRETTGPNGGTFLVGLPDEADDFRGQFRTHRALYKHVANKKDLHHRDRHGWDPRRRIGASPGCVDQFEFALDVFLDSFERLRQQGWNSTDPRSGTRALGSTVLRHPVVSMSGRCLPMSPGVSAEAAG